MLLTNFALLLTAAAAIAAPTPDAEPAKLVPRQKDYAGNSKILQDGVRCRLGASTRRTGILAFQKGTYVPTSCYVYGQNIEGESRWLYADQHKCYFSAKFASYPGIRLCKAPH